jgi:plastocyanin
MQAEARSKELNGCLILSNDGKAMLRLLQPSKIYRVEARPLLFSQNANRLVHVTGYFGSVVEVEDPRVPSFVVDTLDALAPNCSVKLSAAAIRKTLAKLTAPVAQGTVGMTDMGFVPPAITVNLGDKVVWKNSSQVIHNVVDDASKALSTIDVKLPSGAHPFDSGLQFAAAGTILLPRLYGARHLPLRLHLARGIRHEGSSYCQAVTAVGGASIAPAECAVPDGVTKVMAERQPRFYGPCVGMRGTTS